MVFAVAGITSYIKQYVSPARLHPFGCGLCDCTVVEMIPESYVCGEKIAAMVSEL